MIKTQDLILAQNKLKSKKSFMNEPEDDPTTLHHFLAFVSNKGEFVNNHRRKLYTKLDLILIA
jgi:hypothetical protein